MWEAVIGALVAGVLTALKDIFYKGKREQRIIQLESAVVALSGDNKELMKRLDDGRTESIKKLTMLEAAMEQNALVQKYQDASIEEHSEMLNRLSGDHKQLIDAINRQNQVTASMKATMEGLQNLLQNIFAGNLKIGN